MAPFSAQMNVCDSAEIKKKITAFQLDTDALLLDARRTSHWPPMHFSLTGTAFLDALAFLVLKIDPDSLTYRLEIDSPILPQFSSLRLRP